MIVERLRAIGSRTYAMLPAKMQALIASIRAGSFMLGVLLAIALGTGYGIYASGGTSASSGQTLTQVTRRDVTSSVKAVGKVTFASEQKMKFNQRGTVTKVMAKEGDRVAKGAVIAELDKSSVLADIRQSELAIGASSLQLKQLQNDKVKTILDAENDLKTSQEKMPSDLAAAERAVDEKKLALNQARLDLEKQKTTELQSLGSTAQNALTSAEKLLDSFYGILTRDQQTRPPTTGGTFDYTFEVDHLLYNDYGLKTTVQNDYFQAIHGAQDMRTTYGATLTTTQNASTIVAALNDASTLAQNVQKLGEDTYALLQGATTDSKTFTVSALQGYRSTVNANRAAAADLTDAVTVAQANLAATSGSNGIPSVTLKAKEDAVTTAEHNLTLAEENLSILQLQTPGALKSKEEAYNSAKTSTDTNIALKQNSIAQQSASLQKARQTLKDYQLVAPFDGVITHLDYKVGDNLLDTGDAEYLMIQNPDFIVVTIPLDQVDVVRIKENLPAVIVFDAVPGQTFQGSIDGIDAAPVETSGVVSYDVSVKLPTPKDLNILSGMTATVTIETASAKNVLAVPNLAIKRQNASATVQMADGTSAPVELGVTDGRYTEITSGLKEGDTVIAMNVTISSSTTNANQNSAQQLMRATGGFGGSPPGGATATFRRVQ